MKSNFHISISIYSLLLLVQFTLLGQEEILKNFSKEKFDKEYTFYASTLRMLNVTKDKEFKEFVNDIEKIKVYTFDSTTIANKSYTDLASAYHSASFDEYMSMYGERFAYAAGRDMFNEMEIVGVFGQDDFAMAIYITGSIPFQKIPKLVSLIQKKEILDLFEFSQ